MQNLARAGFLGTMVCVGAVASASTESTTGRDADTHVGIALEATHTQGQVPFTYHVIDADNIGIRQVGDVDGDGFADIVARNEIDDGPPVFVWYRYPDWTRHELAGSGNYRSDDIELADIDADGDLDLVFAFDEPGRVHWLANPRPSGDPAAIWGELHEVGTTNAGGASDSYIKDFEVADLSGDGRLDVAARTHKRVFVFRQDDGDAWRQIQSIVIPSHEGMGSGDLDGDGDSDLLLNGFWLEQPATPEGDAWPRHDIDERWYSQSGTGWMDNNAKVLVHDVDRDGRKDAVICHSEREGFPIAWYSAEEPRGGPWTMHTVVERYDYCHTLQAADMDLDGDADFVVGQMLKSADPDEIAVLHNGGDGEAWSKQVVATTGVYHGVVGDIGADGDFDIVGCRNHDARPIELYENRIHDPGMALDRWEYVHVDDGRAKWGDFDDPPWLKYFGLALGDLDGDGDGDIASGRYAYANPGGDMSGEWRRTDLGFNVDAVLITDVDDDMAGDIVAQALPDVWWLEAPGESGGTWSAHLVASVPDTGHRNSQAYALGDVAQGGKPEILLGGGDGVYAIEVASEPDAGDWPTTRVAPGAAGAIGPADIDRDGDVDIVSIVDRGQGAIAWWVNPGDGTGDWARASIGRTDQPIPDRVAVADLDGDGRLDVVVSEEGQPEDQNYGTYWFRQPEDLSTGEWQRTTIAVQSTTNSLDVADMDGDGDPDVITGEHRGLKRVVVWENVVNASAWQPHLVAEGRESHLGTRVADLDGDGDREIVSIAWDAYADLHLWRNDARTAGGGVLPRPTSRPTLTPTPTPTPAPGTTPPSGRADHNVLVLYTFEEGSGSVVHDVSGVRPALDLTLQDPSEARWNQSEGSLSVLSPNRIESLQAADKVNQACRASGEVTLEAWLRPETADQDGPARIVSVSTDSGTRNITLGHGRWGDQPKTVYDVRLRTTATDANGSDSLTTPAGTVRAALQHVVFTRDVRGVRRIYVDGAVVADGAIGGDLSGWASDYKLVLANEATIGRPWLGTFLLVAIHKRALSTDEVMQNFRAGPNPNELPFHSESRLALPWLVR